jgi:hypothetical protein
LAVPELPRKIRTVLDLLVTELELTVAVALAYVGAMVIVAYGIKLVQDSLYDHPLLVPSLVFLPHGVRILAAFLVGARSIMPLAVGTLIGISLGLNGSTDPSAILIPGIFCSYLAFKIFELSGAAFKPGFSSLRQWRGLVLVSFVAALINGLGIVLILVLSGLDEGEVLPRLFVYVVGDTVGAFVLLWGMMRLGRLYRLKIDAQG